MVNNVYIMTVAPVEEVILNCSGDATVVNVHVDLHGNVCLSFIIKTRFLINVI